MCAYFIVIVGRSDLRHFFCIYVDRRELAISIKVITHGVYRSKCISGDFRLFARI